MRTPESSTPAELTRSICRYIDICAKQRERGSITTWSLSAGVVSLKIRPRASSHRSEFIYVFYLSIYSFIHLYLYLFIYIGLYLSIYIYPSIHLYWAQPRSAGAVSLKTRPRASSHRSEVILYKLNHRSTNTGLGSTTSAPRGGDIEDKEREVRAGRS